MFTDDNSVYYQNIVLPTDSGSLLAHKVLSKYLHQLYTEYTDCTFLAVHCTVNTVKLANSIK